MAEWEAREIAAQWRLVADRSDVRLQADQGIKARCSPPSIGRAVMVGPRGSHRVAVIRPEAYDQFRECIGGESAQVLLARARPSSGRGNERDDPGLAAERRRFSPSALWCSPCSASAWDRCRFP